MEKRLPIGIQSFQKIKTDDFLYVDKTEYIYRLAKENVPCFFSRPRRFGKSLLLSAMRCFWEGKKELFEGLRICDLMSKEPDAWHSYPVFYFDFNGKNYSAGHALEDVLDSHLRQWESQYGCQFQQRSLEERFQKLLMMAKEQTGRRCVVLVDEYDKPLLDVIDHKQLAEHNKNVFKGFFSSLKSFDEYLQFVFITGVTKFHKVSIFSDLNQLNDLSMSRQYAGMCGITQAELEEYFSENIRRLAGMKQISEESCLECLRRYYDGYRFHPEGPAVYNPYRLLKAFYENDFGAWWYETGTPSYLVKKIKESDIDLKRFTDRTLYAGKSQLSDFTDDNPNPVPLLYQTGYVTIIAFDSFRERYTLGFPNEEVKYGFLESLVPSYAPNLTSGSGKDIFALDEYVEKGDLDGIYRVLTALFAGIPYTQERNPFEHYFQTVIYLVFTLLGKFVQCEMHMFTGRIDCVVETEKFVYLFEFKRDQVPEKALAQIEDMDYAKPFLADSREVFCIGVSFDSEKRILSGWEVK